MKICFVTHKVMKGDGQGRVNYEVILEALKQDNEIIIISSDLSEDLQNNNRVKWIRLNVGIIPTVLLKYQLFAILSAVWIWFHQKEIDLIVVNGFITYAHSDVNCIHFVHSAWIKSRYHPFHEQKNVKSFYQLFYNGLNALLERSALKRTKKIIAVSQQVKQELVKDARIHAHRISVICNGVDLAEFYPRPVDRADYNLDSDLTYALFAGDLKSRRKNLETVLNAVAEVENLHLLVLGYINKSNYPELAKKLGIDDRVHFLGYRKDVAEIMSLADLFIFPSRYEPFSLVVLEAMASGLPVITSSRCGVIELLSDKSAIIIEDPDDYLTLIKSLKDLAENKDKLQSMAFSARKDAQQNSWTNMSEKYMKLFKYTSLNSSK